MASLLQKYKLPLNYLIEEQGFFLNQITARYIYEDGNRTNDISGYVYTVTNTDTFDQINILVEQNRPLLPIDKFESLRAEGEKVFVQFEDAVIRPYYNERAKQIQDSIKATKVTQISGI